MKVDELGLCTEYKQDIMSFYHNKFNGKPFYMALDDMIVNWLVTLPIDKQMAIRDKYFHDK